MANLLSKFAPSAVAATPVIICDASKGVTCLSYVLAAVSTGVVNTVQFSSSIAGISTALVSKPAELALSLTVQLNAAGRGTTFVIISILNAEGKIIYPVSRQLFELNDIVTRELQTTTSITVTVAASSTMITGAFVAANAQNLLTTVIGIVANGATVSAPTVLCDASLTSSSCSTTKLYSAPAAPVAAAASSSIVGAAVGGAVGGIVVILGIIACVVLYNRQRKNVPQVNGAPQVSKRKEAGPLLSPPPPTHINFDFMPHS